MKRFLSACLISTAVLLSPMAANADVILVDKPVDADQFVAFSDSDGQQIADNFSLSGGATASSASWYGGYSGNAHDATLATSFVIRIFADAGGVAATNFLAEAILNVVGVDTGLNSSFGNYDIFRYTASLDIALAAGDYWFSVLENDLSTGSWFWQASNFVGGEYSVVRGADGVAWTSFSEDNRNEFAFSLTAVPEPGTLALLGIGLFGMGLAGRRKV